MFTVHSILRFGKITKNDIDRSFLVGKPVYIYIYQSKFIHKKSWGNIFTHEEMAREIWSPHLSLKKFFFKYGFILLEKTALQHGFNGAIVELIFGS